MEWYDGINENLKVVFYLYYYYHMKKKITTKAVEKKTTQKKMPKTSTTGVIYGMGVIGAAIYFIGQATSFGMGVIGFLKAIIWPVLLVKGLLKYLWM